MKIGEPRSAVGQGPPLTGGETAMICCAVGYTVTPSLTRNCVSEMVAGVKVTAVAVQIRWRERDLPILETDPVSFGMKGGSTVNVSVTDGSLTTTISLTSTSSTALASPITPLLPPTQQKMSKGAKAGIGAGVGLTVVFILTTLLFFFRRRPRRLQSPPCENQRAKVDDPSTTTAQLSAHVVGRGEVYEMSDVEPAEMSGVVVGGLGLVGVAGTPGGEGVSPPPIVSQRKDL